MLKTRINHFINNKVTHRPPPPVIQLPQPPSIETSSSVASASLSPRDKFLKIVHCKSNGSDLFSTEFEINDVQIAARNILTKGQTHDEIAQLTGASISTRGRYFSAEEKARGTNNARLLYLFIQSDTRESLQLAIEEIKKLIVNTQSPANMSKFNTRPPLVMAPQSNVNQGNSFIEKLSVGLDHAPPTFNVREQVIGVGGANLQYIRNETGAIATLRGRGSLFIDPVLGTESPEHLHLYIEHQRFDGLQAAKQLAKNLIETLQQEVVHLQQQTTQNSQTVALPNNNTIIQQGQHVTHLNVPPPMLIPPPAIQQNSLESQANQAAMGQQNFIQQNPPPNLGAPPQTVQSQQQTIIHQQIIPQTVPIQLQQSNVVIQQPVQQQQTAIGNVNIPPPGIPFPIKHGQIVQFQTPPPTTAGAPHLTQPPPNIQLQQQPPAATQIVLNHPQSYQYQYIQQPVQSDPMQQNQVTIQHIYQPQQQLQGIVQQAQQQPQAHQMQTAQPQQYITVQGNTAYMVPPPTMIHQQQQQTTHAQVQTQIAAQNPNIIFQPPPQMHPMQMQMTHGIQMQTMPPSLPPPNSTIAQENQNNNSEENGSNAKDESKSENDQMESPQKSPKVKTEGDSQSNDSDNEAGNQTQSVPVGTANVPISLHPPQQQTIAIRQPPPTVAASLTLPVTQMAPPMMAVPPPMSCVQHFVGNTLITTQPTTQTHTHQIYSQVPVSIQQITPAAGQQIHVSTANGQHFLVNAAPQWQAPPPTATLTQQSPIHQISQNGTIQNFQITAAPQQLAHNGTDFRAMPPPTLVSQTNPTQAIQQSQLAVAFNQPVQVQFQPHLVQQLPQHQQTIDQTHLMGGQMATVAHTQQQFNVVQQQQPQIAYQQTVMSSFAPQQQQIKQITYQDHNLRTGQKRKHEMDDPALLNHQPRMGMGQRDQNQPMPGNHQQPPQTLHQAPPMAALSSHGNLAVGQSINGSSSSNPGQDDSVEHKTQPDLHQQLAQPPPPPPPTSSGGYTDNRPYYQRDVNDSFNDGPPRPPFGDGGPMNNGGGPMLRGPRFHHNNGMMGGPGGYPMRPPFHMPPDVNGGNFPMHRMNFGPPPPPPSSYRGDCPPNLGYGPPPPRFRGQW